MRPRETPEYVKAMEKLPPENHKQWLDGAWDIEDTLQGEAKREDSPTIDDLLGVRGKG